MVDAIIYVFALLITVPIITTISVYMICKRIVHYNLKAVHIAINWTTCFYIISSLILLKIILGRPFTGIIIGILLSVLTIIIIYQWRTKTEIVFTRAVKILWRICFLSFFILYNILVLGGIVNRILFY